MATKALDDFDTIQAAAHKSAEKAFGQLPNTEPERSEQAEASLPDSFMPAEMEWLEEQLGREPTDEERDLYASMWEGRYYELMEMDDLA